MVKNIILYALITIILLSSITYSAVECQYSEDNSTWVEINSSTGGFLYEEGNTAGIEFLDDNTLYYFRCKNSTTTWSYLYEKTERGKWEEMYLVFGVIGTVFVVLGAFILLKKR